MRARDFIIESELYQPPSLSVGDKILTGKFKNSPAEIKGFKKDKHNQPVLKTNKGDVQLFKPRISKLMPEGAGLSEDGNNNEDYRIAHRAPMHNSGSPLYDLSGTYPDDIYGPNGIQYYGTREPADAQSMRIIRLSKGKPNQGIQIFRAVPKDVTDKNINPGDWVTISRMYAQQHGGGLGKYKILTKIVSAKTLYTNGDSLHEWGYDPSGVELPKDVTEAETDTPNARKISNQLRAAGYSHVGTGADATVWAKDDSYVIKILMPEDLGTKAEQVFRKFYKFAMSHQYFDCMPKFNEVNTIDINGKDYTQIEMERLIPIKTNSFEEGVIWFFSDFVANGDSWEQVDSALRMPDIWKLYNESVAGGLARYWKTLAVSNTQQIKELKTLYIVMQMLYKTGSINKFGWDLHTANVMQRKNGQLVIIDPWFSESKGSR
jgi:hypothetical protein